MMQRPVVSGSKPKKLIPKIVLTNPSLISLSMTSVLDPENHSLPKIQNAIQLRKQAVAQKESMIFNELSPARFAREASLRNMHPKGLENPQGKEHLFASRRSSMGMILSPPEISKSPSRLAKDLGKEMSILSRRSSTPTLPSLHYASLNQIKARQAKPFNIISNM